MLCSNQFAPMVLVWRGRRVCLHDVLPMPEVPERAILQGIKMLELSNGNRRG